MIGGKICRRCSFVHLLQPTGMTLGGVACALCVSVLLHSRTSALPQCTASLPRGSGQWTSCVPVLCCVVLCCVVLCCAVLCCVVLCCALLCCVVLCCAVLCCVHSTAPHSLCCVCCVPCHLGLFTTTG